MYLFSAKRITKSFSSDTEKPPKTVLLQPFMVFILLSTPTTSTTLKGIPSNAVSSKRTKAPIVLTAFLLSTQSFYTVIVNAC